MLCLSSKNVNKARQELEALLTAGEDNQELRSAAQQIIQKALDFENAT
jgi:hypothetical protein